jgi:hypothetical protein
MSVHPSIGAEQVTASERKYFFIHVMKTAGATLRWHIRSNYKRFQVYPFKQVDLDVQDANYSIEYLTSLDKGRRRRIRVFTGHFPFVAVELLGLDVTTLTILRDPVERTLSYLRHCKRYHEPHRELALEEIYEDQFFFPLFIHNHQAKLFSLTPGDHPKSYMDVLDVDARRLEIAKANIERVDALGMQDDFDWFLADLERRFGWQPANVKDVHVIRGSDVSASFRRRIAEDNAADVEFYEYARSLYERRRGERPTTVPPRRQARPAKPRPAPVPVTPDARSLERVGPDKPRFFFVHMQKTAGTRLTRAIRDRFPERAVYPHDLDGDRIARVISVDHLRAVWASRGDEIQVICGHFPLCTTELLGGGFTTLTILRHPLERTISYLRHHQRRTPTDADLSLEEVYDDEFRFHGLVHNHMTKMLSLSPEEMTEGAVTRVEFTPERLELAKERLANVDAVGLQSDYEGFSRELSERFDWDLGDPLPPRIERPPAEISDSFRDRVLADNSDDLALYEFAQGLVARRSRVAS